MFQIPAKSILVLVEGEYHYESMRNYAEFYTFLIIQSNDSNVLLFCCKQSKLKKKTLALGSQTQSGSWAAETDNKVSRAELKNTKNVF